MKSVKPKFERPITGVGVVKLGKSTFSVEVAYKNEKGKDDSESFQFKMKDLPEDLPEGFELKNGKSYWFNIRADGSAINNIRPAKGVFKVKCVGMATKEDDRGNEEFVVLEKKGDFGAYKQIVANLVVQEGDAAGTVFPQYLPFGSENSKGDWTYRFAPDEDGNFTVVGNPDKSKNVAALFDFVQYTGLGDVELPFPDTEDEQDVLEVLHKAIRKQKKVFSLIVENGYTKSMTSADDDVEVEEVDEDEAPAPKKSKKVVEEDDEEVVAPKKSAKKVVVDDDEEDEAPAPKKKVARPKFEEED